MSEAHNLALEEEIRGLLAEGFIQLSLSKIGALIFPVPKQDKSLRWVIDYRGLNEITKKNAYPLPVITHLLNQLRTGKVFSKIDLRGAYNLLRVRKGDGWKTAFRTRWGAYEYLVMPFGLTNAPACFQQLVNEILAEHVDRFVIVYLDDIMIYSQSEVDHVTHVRTVLELLRTAGLYAKATKCEFHKTELDFLGFVVGSKGISMDQKKVATVTNWPTPWSVKKVQSFLGFANFYRQFNENYSRRVIHLNGLIKLGNEKSPFAWTDKCQGDFDNLKTAMSTAPVLSHFVALRRTVLETDASDYVIGAILSQFDEDGVLHPCGYASRKMQPAELNYKIHDKELLGIVWALHEWRLLLLSCHATFDIITNHDALKYFMVSKLLTRRQARWAEFLANFDFCVFYRPGRIGTKPDALSCWDDVYPEGGDGVYAKNNPHNI